MQAAYKLSYLEIVQKDHCVRQRCHTPGFVVAAGLLRVNSSRRPQRRSSLTFRTASSTVSELISAFSSCDCAVARMPEHHHGRETVVRVETKHEEVSSKNSYPKPADFYDARLFPGAKHHVYYESENETSLGPIAATVHGNIMVLGKVIEVTPSDQRVSATHSGTSAPPSWGEIEHRDRFDGTRGVGMCALGLLNPGIKVHVRCTACTVEDFDSRRAMCCARPQKCARPPSHVSCARKFDEKTCEDSGCNGMRRRLR